jgi:hypothetical protein
MDIDTVLLSNAPYSISEVLVAAGVFVKRTSTCNMVRCPPLKKTPQEQCRSNAAFNTHAAIQ